MLVGLVLWLPGEDSSETLFLSKKMRILCLRKKGNNIRFRNDMFDCTKRKGVAMSHNSLNVGVSFRCFKDRYPPTFTNV